MWLATSVARTINPPIDPLAVQPLIEEIGYSQDPAYLEAAVFERIPYQYDWHTYNVPWYFPTVEEALASGAGDCKSQFVVLASVFEALDIPYSVHYSPTHIWVSWEGRRETAAENEQVSLAIQKEGDLSLQVPQVDLVGSFGLFWEAFWVDMPQERRGMVVAGLLIFGPGALLPRFNRRLADDQNDYSDASDQAVQPGAEANLDDLTEHSAPEHGV